MNSILYQQVNVEGVNVFYREAGSKDLPTLLLLHGFPSSSHMFRDLIPLLSHQFHIVAPDLPGFGRSDVPSHDEFDYTFDNLSNVISSFTEKLGLDRYAIYVFDYGAPVGFRLAVQHPQRVTAIISQNGNAYNEGLSDGWNPIRKYWELPNADNREALRTMLSPETTYWQYTHGVPNPEQVSPDGYALDNYYLDRANVHEAQLDLFLDYATNVNLYPTFHKYFRDHQPPLLAVWGRQDPFFLPEGASAFKRDLPYARVVFYETGHFALETHASEIAHEISTFLV